MQISTACSIFSSDNSMSVSRSAKTAVGLMAGGRQQAGVDLPFSAVIASNDSFFI